jgi:WD40 repeat protein
MEFSRQAFAGALVAGVLLLPMARAAAEDAKQPVDPSRREYFTPGLILETGARNAACDVLRFTQDGKFLLATGDDKVVRNWRVTPEGLAPSDLPILRWRIFREVRGNIYALDLSPDQKRVLVAGHGMQGLFGACILDRDSANVLNATTGDAGKMKAQGTIWSAAFSPSGKRVVLGTEKGTVWLWEPAAASLRLVGDHKISAEGIAAGVGKVYFASFVDEQTVVSVAGNGKMVRWDLSGAPGRTLHDFGGQIAAPPVLSPDGRWLGACLDGTKDTRQAQVVSFPGGLPEPPLRFQVGNFPHRLAFSRNGQKLAIAVRLVNPHASFFQEQGGYIALYDRARNPQAPTRGPEQSMYAEALAFSPVDDDLLAAAGGNDHEVALWNLRTGKKVGDDIKSPGSCLWSVALSEKGRYVAFQDKRNPAAPSPNQRGVGPWRYFDLQTRTFVDARIPPFVPAPPLETAGGWRVVTSTPDVREAEIWFVQKQGRPPVPLPWNRLLDEFPRCYAFLPEQSGRPTRLLVGHYWGVSMFELPDAGPPRRIRLFKGHEGYVTSLAVSKDGRKLITASRDQTLGGWDLDEWPSHPTLGAELFPQNDAAGRPALKIGKVDLGSSLWETGLSTGDQIVLVVTEGGRNVVYNVTGLAKHARSPGTVDDALETLRSPPPGKEIYLGWRRPGNPEVIEQLTSVVDRPLWRFFPMRNKEWVLWRWRDYYYDTSTNGDFQIGWQRSFDITKTPTFFRAEQFRNKFLKPELVAKTLREWKSEQGLVRFQQIEPPTVEMAVSTDKVVDNDVDIKVRVVPQGPTDNQSPDRVIVWLNDYEFKVWQRPELLWDGEAFTVKARLPRETFRRGQNLVTAQCYSKAELRADANPVRIDCERAFERPKMVGLVVGVGNYAACRARKQRASFEDLRATDDADVVFRALGSQKGKLYANAQLMLLKDKDATPKSILEALDKLSAKVGPDDLLIFHLGGHGVQKSELVPVVAKNQLNGLGSFLYCFGDFDLTKLQNTTVGFEQLSAKFVKMPCHKILLIDACHSGAASSGLDSDNNPIRILTRDGVGPVILTSCDPKQSAQEDGTGTLDVKGGFGFFTIAIRRIFEDAESFSAADTNRDGVLDAKELALGIRSQVASIVQQFKDEGVKGIDSQDPVDFVPRLSERLPVAKK